MPYINIKVTNEGVTTEQERQLIAGATRLLQEVLNKNSATTVVVIDEVDTDNWGIAGEQGTQLRRSPYFGGKHFSHPSFRAHQHLGAAAQPSQITV